MHVVVEDKEHFITLEFSSALSLIPSDLFSVLYLCFVPNVMQMES